MERVNSSCFMKKKLSFRNLVLWIGAVGLVLAIGGGMASGADRHKRGPHGGTPVLIGDHHFHLELVRDAAAELMQAYVLDDHFEKYVSVRETNFTMTATFGGRTNRLDFKRIANPVRGKIPATSSLFEGRADWIKSATNFTGHIPTITLKGQTFTNISFPFPKGTQHTH
jgi:hypothetical protein